MSEKAGARTREKLPLRMNNIAVFSLHYATHGTGSNTSPAIRQKFYI
jgi:hypothetical protein